ncbi:glycosyltransferase family 2 protein [Methylothermus subterraneus]|nr:glycosyl transferase family protein [uncultured Gammaproteobacteria bacterium]
MPDLIASIVVYRSPLPALEKALFHLRQAGECAVAQGQLGAFKVVLVDNASGPEYRRALQDLIRRWRQSLRLELILSPANGGYGLGHNQVATQGGDFRLVLNPDVFLETKGLAAALEFLKEHPEVGVVVPRALDGQGQRAYLCKRYPSVLVLALRGFAPAWLRAPFRSLLAAYEMRDLNWDRAQFDLSLVSGCCLLVRGRVWRQTGGFDPQYFLYFEDFDFSLRARRIAKIAYLPDFQIVHLGGGAARKGIRHTIWFLRAAFRFFRQYGWRWIHPGD